MPLVSVILPTTGKSPYIVEAISSVLCSNYQPIEIIVVDDSKNLSNSEQIKREIVKSGNDNIRYIESGGKGLPSARNIGVEASIGSILMFIDDDDRWSSTKISRQIRMWEKGHVFQCSAFHKIDHNGQSLPSYHKIIEQIIQFPASLKGPFLPPSGWLVDKQVFNDVGGFNKNWKHTEDKEFMIRASTMVSIFVDPTVTFAYRIHEKTMSSARSRSLYFNVKLFNQYKADKGVDPYLRSQLLWCIRLFCETRKFKRMMPFLFKLAKLRGVPIYAKTLDFARIFAYLTFPKFAFKRSR